MAESQLSRPKTIVFCVNLCNSSKHLVLSCNGLHWAELSCILHIKGSTTNRIVLYSISRLSHLSSTGALKGLYKYEIKPVTYKSTL